jgi:hypothetical protein
MWAVLDFAISLLLLCVVGGGLVWAAYAYENGLVGQYLAAVVVVVVTVMGWVVLLSRSRASWYDRRCPVCRQWLRLDRRKDDPTHPATAECKWCGASFIWMPSQSRYGVGRWERVSPPRRPPG